VQTTIAMHVDDLMVTSISELEIEAVEDFLRAKYKEISVKKGKIVNYVGMTFDFGKAGEVGVTMQGCEEDIITGAGDVKIAVTPALDNLFDTDTSLPPVPEDVRQWFHTLTAKMLYLAKRGRPEILTAVSYLCTRVDKCTEEDVTKLKRAMGYLKHTKGRGIRFKIGDSKTVTAYIDASYGVHTAYGKSHTGCVLMLGDAGPVQCKSAKQKIVTKSSTEAELVALSDSANQAIHLKNFVEAQGYDVGPVQIKQDNMSCMALVKKGAATSERSRHIAIRYFWVRERVDSGEVQISHEPTETMWANLLTKAVQGAQFTKERAMVTNWI
jgi:hypothetical protein